MIVTRPTVEPATHDYVEFSTQLLCQTISNADLINIGRTEIEFIIFVQKFKQPKEEVCRVGQIKRGQLTFLLVTSERYYYKIKRFLAGIDYHKASSYMVLISS